MTLLILSAGKATRLTDGSCKAALKVEGSTMYEWQCEAAGVEDAIVVVRAQHQDLFPKTIVCGEPFGPGYALAHTVHYADLPDEPLTVLYADTWLSSLPHGVDWTGISTARGGRGWEVLWPDGRFSYEQVPEYATCTVNVGAYNFGNVDWLRATTSDTLRHCLFGEVQMAKVIEEYGGLRPVEIPSWQDVGDHDALARFKVPA